MAVYSLIVDDRCLDFSIEDDVLVTGSESGDLVVMEFSSGKIFANHIYDGGVFDLKYVAGRRSCVCATLTSELDLFSISQNAVIGSFKGHRAAVSSVRIVGDLVVSYPPPPQKKISHLIGFLFYAYIDQCL